MNKPNEDLENEKEPLSREDEKDQEIKFNNNSYEEIILGLFFREDAQGLIFTNLLRHSLLF